ncbi:M14 family metallopeptidase [Cytophagales bacterium LB-30]|uniref:M14 family metallopeptidase n=2 Tax=Shiella aurantiaca TaxID=3058365 RepID=A0ABT8F8S3_9BACT|nr:M14 family metallopeptidase [Shiella aurantiaca]
MKKLLFGCLASLSFLSAMAQVKSPEQFLGYALGERFTPHHKVMDYYEHVASETGIVLQNYGQTYEMRPLVLAYVSTSENLKNLEQIRNNNLKRAGLQQGNPEGKEVAVVWLSYNVHGNESVSTEASMQTIYELLTDPAKKVWLENTLVIIDPCINPDGRERYVQWYNRVANQAYNPNPDALEHHEPWPGGRANHYLFDLNRDWAWQTQVESQQRLKEYNRWLPQVHVDFHEQGVDNPYYFAPAAEPLHEQITPWQREFQVTIGKNHAKYFDKEGWLYFTGEVFDLLYPSYGDTYPMYNGSIGMTYEQGGSGRAGLGIITELGDTLSLKDRIAHHYTTGISTVEISAQHAKRLLSEYQQFFKNSSSSPKGKYKSYVIKAENGSDKLKELTTWLDQLGIQYGQAAAGKSAKGFSYQSGGEESFTLSTRDVVINAYQPKSVLVQVLFEPKTQLADSLTYDITAWAVPYAQGLQAYALSEKIGTKAYEAPKVETLDSIQAAYAYVLNWQHHADARFLAELLQMGMIVRYASEPFSLDGRTFGRGSLVITRRGNESFGLKWFALVQETAKKHGRILYAAQTGFVDSGKDFGSESVRIIQAPKVALLAGDGTSSLSFGETWYYFEQELGYTVTVIDTDDFNRVNLSTYDVLILPDGYYGSFANENQLKSLSAWVQAGGKLILIDNALSAFAGKEGFDLSSYQDEEEKKLLEKKEKSYAEQNRLRVYANRERDGIKDFVGGGIFKLRMDNTHPLAFGYSSSYFTLKTNSDRYAYLNDGWNVGTFANAKANVSGFVGARVEERLNNTLVFGVQEKGRGQVIYLGDNPLFRAFWKNGRLLMDNALFFVGQ